MEQFFQIEMELLDVSIRIIEVPFDPPCGSAKPHRLVYSQKGDPAFRQVLATRPMTQHGILPRQLPTERRKRFLTKRLFRTVNAKRETHQAEHHRAR